MRKLKKIAAGIATAAIAFTMVATMAPSVANAAVSKQGEKAAKAEFDPNGTYHAYFGMQHTSWIFRNEWVDSSFGLNGTDFPEGADYSTLLQSLDGVQIKDGTITDAEITGNGVYSVSVEGLNNALKDAETADPSVLLAMLYVSTDVPASAKDTFKISDWKLLIDGKEQTLPEEIFFNAEAEEACPLIRFDVVNTYQRDKGEYADCPTVSTPADSIKIVFTVSGMANDNPDAVEETPAPAEDDATSGDDASKGDDASSAESDSSSDSGSSMVPIVVGVVVVVVVAGVAIVMTKKKK